MVWPLYPTWLRSLSNNLGIKKSFVGNEEITVIKQMYVISECQCNIQQENSIAHRKLQGLSFYHRESSWEGSPQPTQLVFIKQWELSRPGFYSVSINISG